MAITKGKGKTRLDFSGAMSEMIEQTESHSNQTGSDLSRREVLPQTDILTERVETETSPALVVDVSKKEKPVTSSKATKIEQNLEKRLLQTKKSRGVQKSVYFDADVYAYIERLSEKYHLKFSAVLNELLRDMIR